MSKSLSTPLTMIQVDGSEATDFIQNMFCNDVMELGATSAQFSGLCNPKGRLLANGFLLRRGQGLGFLLHCSMAQAIVQRLNMYKLRADVDIKADPSSICFALDQPAPDANPDPNPGAHFLGRYQSSNQSLSFYTCNEAASETTNSTWNGALQNLRLAIIEERSSAQFVPQMVNMDQLDGVSFNKGCYPGQEIVARLHFLGKLKQRGHAAQLQNHNQSIAVGDQIFVDQAEGSASVGTVTHVFRENATTHMLLSLKDRALEVDRLVNQQDTPIRISK